MPNSPTSDSTGQQDRTQGSAASEPLLVYTSAATDPCERCGKASSYVVVKPLDDGQATVCSEHLAHAVGAVLYAV